MLELKNISFAYPGAPLPVLRDLSLTVQAGRCAAITGGNGSGKSTLVKIISGLIPKLHAGLLDGKVTFNGAAEFLPAVVLQDLDGQLLRDTVKAELGFYLKYGSGARDNSSVKDIAAVMGLENLLEKHTAVFSSGQKQRFLLASALHFSKSGLIVLDEPNAFLDIEAKDLLLSRLTRLKAEGATIFLAGHDFSGFEALIDEFYFLQNGTLLATDSQAVVCKRLGKKLTIASRFSVKDEVHSVEKISLSAHKLSFTPENAGPVLTGCSLPLATGAITGLVGANGSGKTTMARLLSGYYPSEEGRILFEGKIVTFDWLKKNIVLVSSRPLTQLCAQTVEENLCFAQLRANSSDILTYKSGLEISGLEPLLQKKVSRLSYGEMQKVLTLSAILAAPKVLIIDEPLLSLDSDSVARLVKLLDLYLKSGGSVLLISHLEDLISGLCYKIHNI